MGFMMQDNPLSVKELRLLFISMVRAQYELLISEGMLTSQHALTIALLQSLEEAEADAVNGRPLNDLQYLRKYNALTLKFKVLFKKATCNIFKNNYDNIDAANLRGTILEKFAFMSAHERAQEFFQEQLGACGKDLSEGGKIVISESKIQVKEVIDELDCSSIEDFVGLVSTQNFCEVLLNKGIKYIETLNANGLLKDSETEELVEEIVHHLDKVKQTKVELFCKKEGTVEDILGNSERNEAQNHLAKIVKYPDAVVAVEA